MDELRRMLDLVTDPDPQIRRYAVGRLEELGDGLDDEELLEELRKATADPDPSVGHEANRVLVSLLHRSFGADGRKGGGSGSWLSPPVLPSGEFEDIPLAELRNAGLARLGEVLDRLHEIALGRDPALAKWAVISLAKLGSPQSVKVLEEAITRPGTGEVSAVALSQIPVAGSLSVLLKTTEAEPGSIRSHAVLALGAFDDGTARRRLCELSGDRDPVVRANVACALGMAACGGTGLDGVMSALGRLLRDPEVWVVLAAVEALSAFSSAEAAGMIEEACSDTADDRVRASCLIALGRLGRADTFDFIASFLHSDDDRVRANAVEALGMLGVDGARIKAALVPLSGDANNRVVANVAVALHPFESAKTFQVVRSMLASDDEWMVASGLWCLGEMRDPFVLDELLACIDRFSGERLSRALKALGKWSGDRPVPGMLRMLGHPDPMVRSAVARTLGRFSDGSVVNALTRRLEVEEEPTVRSAIVLSIGRHPEADLEALTGALSDPSPRVVADAVEALGVAGDLQSAGAIRPFLANGNNRVRANACVALWRAGELEVADDLLAMFSPVSQACRRSAVYAAGEMGRILRCLGREGAGPSLLAACKKFLEQLSRTDELPETLSSSSRDTAGGALALERVVELSLTKGLEAALEQLERIPSSVALPVEAAFLSYRLLVQAGRHKDAFRVLESIEELPGAYVAPVLELAHGYSRLKLERKAVVGFLEAYRRHQAVLSELLETAAKAVEAGRLSDATQVCRFLMSNPAVGSDIHLRAGREMLAAGEYEKAFTQFLHAHLFEPEDRTVSLDYAYTACRLGRLELGALLCREVLFLSGEERGMEDEPAGKAARMLAAIESRMSRGQG